MRGWTRRPSLLDQTSVQHEPEHGRLHGPPTRISGAPYKETKFVCGWSKCQHRAYKGMLQVYIHLRCSFGNVACPFLSCSFPKCKTTNSVARVCERTTPTERPPLVGGRRVNFWGYRVPCGQRDGYLRPYSTLSRQETLLFYQVAPQLYSRGWVDPVPGPILLRKSGSIGNRSRDLCICSQELWPLDHRDI
jgi:hypothetical protein